MRDIRAKCRRSFKQMGSFVGSNRLRYEITSKADRACDPLSDTANIRFNARHSRLIS